MPAAAAAAIMMCMSRSSPAVEVATGLSTHMGGRSVGSKKKVRHHVNPLKASHMKMVDLPERWAESSFAQPAAPLHVDIGCARGVFCLELAQKAPNLNVLGLEIRQVLADAATADAKALSLSNVAFVGCNANVNLRPILERAGPTCTMSSASIQFPEPWFKKRHAKRRVVQPELVSVVADFLVPGGWLWMQTDVLEVAAEMRQTVRATEPERLQDVCLDIEDWSAEKPSGLQGVGTERERASTALGRPVYCCLFQKRGVAG